MSLEVKRAIKNFEDNLFASCRDQIVSKFGYDIEIDFNWDSFQNKDSIAMLEHGFFGKFLDDMENICSDDLGKEALKNGLTKIVVAEGTKDVKFDKETKTLFVTANFGGSSSEYPSFGEYRTAIEPHL
ncbi:MAG: hypothetical protein KDD58_08290 [Bdellovibrionales bacterium]|nr:hypothetical protein [Bdellovibrionales bacterium]